jgi:CRP-like cAMP-binding protein
MSEIQQADVENRLLSLLATEDYLALQPYLRRRSVEFREVLAEPGQRMHHAYFPENGIVSVVASNVADVEVGVVGREGCVGASVVLEVEHSSVKAYGQMTGQGLTLPAPILLDAAAQSRSLRRVFLRYTHAFWLQTAEAACATARHTIEQRLARWLLMCHDRADGDELALTHEFLATMLGVRRPGVTIATHVLEGQGLIRAQRRRITILDRAGLECMAGSSYGAADAEYERILGVPVRADRTRAAASLSSPFHLDPPRGDDRPDI